MSNIGKIVWQDLSVPDATAIRDFYAQVVGWQFGAQNMGDYDDYNMNLPETGETVAGICHAKGINSAIPSQWLIYITVADIDQSVANCIALGGKVLDGIRNVGKHRFCIIQDPAGAVAGLITA
jgi:predicted enzyme related to lactoylglutathione lyase